MYTVYFTRKFEAGLLTGFTIPDTITFASWYSANDWIENTKNRLIEKKYRIVSAWIEAQPSNWK